MNEPIDSSPLTPSDQTLLIKRKALEIGFDLVQVARTDPVEESGFLDAWVESGYFGEMTYLQKTLEKRKHPSLVLENAKTIICCALNYYTFEKSAISTDCGKFSRYTWGRDYHQIITEKLKSLAQFIHDRINPKSQTKFYTDTGPILEKSHAQKAGIGWIGKNTCLINPQYGSWLFLGEILTDLDLIPDSPSVNQCRACDLCLRACPTGALEKPGVLNATKCISYLTLEHKGRIDPPKHSLLGNHVAGCDLCQEACPKNQKPIKTKTKDFFPTDLFDPQNPGSVPLEALIKIGEDHFKKTFLHTALHRMSYSNFKRNIVIAMGNSGNNQWIEILKKERASQDPELLEYIDESIRKLHPS